MAGAFALGALGCSPSSRDACESFVVHARALDCVDVDPPTCSADEDRCGRADYWTCLRASTGCTDAGVFVDETAACDPTCVTVDGS